AQKRPETERLARVVVAVGVGVAFQQPAPGTAFAAGIGLFLPTLQDARGSLQGGTPGLRIAQMDEPFVGSGFGLRMGQRANGLEEAMFDFRGPPRRPEMESDMWCLERQAVEVDSHNGPPRHELDCSGYGSFPARFAEGNSVRRPAKLQLCC